jgi:hypothetical protein
LLDPSTSQCSRTSVGPTLAPVLRSGKCPQIRGSTTGVSPLPPGGTCGRPSWSRESGPAARRAGHPSTPLGAYDPRAPGSARWAACGTGRSEVSLSEARRARRRGACGRCGCRPVRAASCGPSAGQRCAARAAAPTLHQLRTMPSEPTPRAQGRDSSRTSTDTARPTLYLGSRVTADLAGGHRRTAAILTAAVCADGRRADLHRHHLGQDQLQSHRTLPPRSNVPHILARFPPRVERSRQARLLAYHPNWYYNPMWCSYPFCKDEEDSVSAV